MALLQIGISSVTDYEENYLTWCHLQAFSWHMKAIVSFAYRVCPVQFLIATVHRDYA